VTENDPNFNCGIGPAFNVIGGRWKAAILCELNGQARRFGELRRLVSGISEKMLIQQLRELAADGLVVREARNAVPPHVEYSLSALGDSLNIALVPLADWGLMYAQRQTPNRNKKATSQAQPVQLKRMKRA
jgi:DNA-binding HxlR family transcriptional regulator